MSFDTQFDPKEMTTACFAALAIAARREGGILRITDKELNAIDGFELKLEKDPATLQLIVKAINRNKVIEFPTPAPQASPEEPSPSVA